MRSTYLGTCRKPLHSREAGGMARNTAEDGVDDDSPLGEVRARSSRSAPPGPADLPVSSGSPSSTCNPGKRLTSLSLRFLIFKKRW